MKQIKIAFVWLFLVLPLTACVAKYQQVALMPSALNEGLSSTGSVYVAMPEDGRYGTIVYPGSGTSTATTFVKAFSAHVPDVYMESITSNSFDESLRSAKTKGVKYLVYPEIGHWEERATEWSDKPDRIEIRIQIADVLSGNILDNTMLTGESKWATLGGDHPQDLLEEPIKKYVDALFEKNGIGSGSAGLKS